MRIVLLFTIMPFLCFCTKAQKRSDLDSLINISLVSYIDRNSNGNPVCLSENLHILTDNYPRGFVFCQEIQDLGPKYFSLSDISLQKEAKKEKKLKTIFLDIILVGNQLKITFSDRIVTVKRNNDLQIAISDWGDFVYEYSCEKERWIFHEVKYKGI